MLWKHSKIIRCLKDLKLVFDYWIRVFQLVLIKPNNTELSLLLFLCTCPKKHVKCEHSWKWKSSSQSYPEPGLCTWASIVAHCQKTQDAGKLLWHWFVYHWNQTFASSTRTQAESKFCLKITGITLKVLIRNYNHHPFTPLLNKFTCDGPDAGAWKYVSVKHTQLKLVVSLLQFSNHFKNKLEVTLAVADERVEQLRSTWI